MFLHLDVKFHCQRLQPVRYLTLVTLLNVRQASKNNVVFFRSFQLFNFYKENKLLYTFTVS